MQLKSLAKSTEVLNKVTSILKNTELSSIAIKKELETIGKSYTTETLKSAIAQSTLNKEQIEAILVANGLQGELLETTVDELANAASTNAVAASQKTATASTLEFGTAIKGLGIQIRKLLTAHPIIATIALAGATLFGITKAIKHFTVSLKEQQEITQNLQNELSELESDISDVNSKLQTTADRIDELNAKDSLSFVEQEELENLIAQNDELERTNRLLAEQEDLKRRELAESVRQEFNKKYENQQYVRLISDQELNEMAQKRARWEELRLNSGYNTEEEIAEMQRLRQELDEWDSLDSSFVNFPNYIKSVIDAYDELNQRKRENNDLSEQEETLLSQYRNELVTYAVDLEDYVSRYGIDDETSRSWKDLSASIYECLYPAEQLTERFNEVFDSLSENVQSELKQLAKDGSLSIDSLSDDIINKFSEAGFSATEVIEQIRSMIEDLGDSVTEEPVVPLTITETVEQINTQLKSAFNSLQSAYQDIFTLDDDTGEKIFSLDDVDISTFESIRSELEKLGEIDGINVNYSQFEDFVSVLSNTSSTAEEVQEQFDKLATSIIYTSDCTNMSAETYDLLVKSLTEMGVTNADEVLSRLRDLQEELVDLGYDFSNITAKEAEDIINLGRASAETEEYLRRYLVQKELAQNPLSTLEDILQLESLCNALGVTGQLYEYVIDLKRAFAAKENGAVSAGLDESIESIQAKIKELSNGEFDFGFQFNGLSNKSKSGSSSSSAKDTVETFDWIEQAIENVEKEIEELDEIANSSYSTFSEKNEALAQEISKVSEEIGLQQQAYDEYMRKADSIPLSEHYKQLVQSGAINIEDISDENLQKLIGEYQTWYDKAQDVSDAIKQLKTDMKDMYVSAYELQTDNLKDRLDSDSITEKQYLDGLKEAYEKFYADLEDFAEQYHEAVLDYLAEEKDYLNSVANAAASLLDTEIDRIKEDAELQADSIQRQIDLLEAKKKPLQDELDALEDKAKKEDLILNLQKAQYELARSENQRTKLVYKDGQMVYTADPTAIRDAQQGVDDAKLEIQKQSIQDQIDALDDEIDRYNDLIDQINNAADVQIEALEKIKNKWQEVIDQQEQAKTVLLLTGEFGADAVTKILTGNDDDLLAQWKDSYISTLAGIDMESQGYIGDMTEQMASLYGVDLSPLQEQFGNVNDTINGMTDALGRAASAIGSGISVPNYNADSDNTSPTNLKDSITGVGIAADESLPNVTSNMDEIAETARNAALDVDTVANAIDSIPEHKDVTISVHTTGTGYSGISSNVSQIAYTGNAYADGTEGLEHTEKNALRSEYGQPELTVYPDGKTELTTQPVMSDLPKGTVVYNEEQTKKILNNKADVQGTAYADGTDKEGWITTPSGDTLRPLQSGDKMYDMIQKWDAYMSSMDNNIDAITQHVVSEQSRQMNEIVKQITNSNIVNNNQPHISVGDVHITCPGVTSQEVAKQVGTEINNIFSGLSLKAAQRANITR